MSFAVVPVRSANSRSSDFTVICTAVRLSLSTRRYRRYGIDRKVEAGGCTLTLTKATLQRETCQRLVRTVLEPSRPFE
jgi:hypothetical protein